MKQKLNILKSACLIGLLTFIVSCQSDGVGTDITNEVLVSVTESKANGFNSQTIDGQYIVRLHEGTLRGAGISKADYKNADARLRGEINRLFSSLGIAPGKIKATYGFATEGFAVELTDEQLGLLQRDS